MKICTKCNKELPLEEFSMILRRGKRVRNSRCKPCVAEYKHEHYLKHKQRYKDRAKKWAEDNPERSRETRKEYYERTKGARKGRRQEYLSRPEVRARIAERFREYRKDDDFLFKEKARGVLNKRVKTGKIEKPSACQVCGKSGYVEAHHHDYTRPLDVVWVCKQCHEDIHHSNERQAS